MSKFSMSRLRPSGLWVVAGLGWAAQAVLDPLRPAGIVGGPLLVVAGLLWEAFRRRPWKRYLPALILAGSFSLSALSPIEFRADWALYYAPLRSLHFDGDIDVTNEWEALGFPQPVKTETGLADNKQPLGPALLWSPFYYTAHTYVYLGHLIGGGLYQINGYSPPYRRSTALGTVTIAVLGAILLAMVLARWYGWTVATIAVLGSIFATSVAYYIFIVPAMGHGVTFGVAAGLIWAWDRARRQPTLVSWVVLGAALGLVTLCRWQAAFYAIPVLLLALRGLWTRAVKLSWLLAGGVVGWVVFIPQFVTWKILYSRWLTIPQGGGFLDFTSPYWVDVLFSANHGFFNWTPLMILGFVGLLLGSRRDPLLFGGGLAVFVATVWINGSVAEGHWAGDDAFGARRFVLVVPVMALGLGVFLDRAARAFVRIPLLAPATLVALLILWNLGFISNFNARKYQEAAPLEHLAKDQARSLRLAVQELFGWIGGDEGRALAYKFFSAEYFYTRFNRSGTIRLKSADERYLLRGWHTPSRRTAKRPFRRALFPEACVRIPLEAPFDLRVVITAQAPQTLDRQNMTLAVNDRVVASAQLHAEWRDVRVFVPQDHLVPGENALCLRFSDAPPEENGIQVAAHVALIQLP